MPSTKRASDVVDLNGVQVRMIEDAAACGPLLRRVPEDDSGSARLAINADACRTLDAVVPCQSMVKLASVSSV